MKKQNPTLVKAQNIIGLSKHQLLIIMAITSVALMSTSWLLYEKKQLTTENASMISFLKQEKTELQSSYDQMLVALQAYEDETIELDSALIEMSKEIEGRKDELNRLLTKQENTVFELTQAKGLMKNLRGITLQYRKKIDQLQAENEQLAVEKQQLTTKNQNLSTTNQKLAVEKQNLNNNNQQLQNKNQQLTSEKDHLEDEKATLAIEKEDLEVGNNFLVAVREQLKEEKATLQTMVKEKENNLSQLATNHADLEKEKKQLEANQQQLKTEQKSLTNKQAVLEQQISRAAVLQTVAVTANGVRSKRNGKEVTVKKAKRAEKIRVCFDVLENPVASIGAKDILVRLVSPGGTTLAIQDLGSGVFTQAELGEEMQYTTKASINYQQEQKNYCVYWTQDTGFGAGAYSAELYHEGYLIGDALFSL